MANSRPAVLFDIDGTLVDSNYLARPRLAAGVRRGRPASAGLAHSPVDRDGRSILVDELSQGAPGDVQKRLRTCTRYYQAGAALLTTLPGARRLLRTVAERDLQVVLATSAPEDELALLRSTLDCDDVVSAITSSADVEQAKPNPGIVEVALAKAGVSAERAVFVGDAVWDVEASGRAGLPCIAVLSGGCRDASSKKPVPQRFSMMPRISANTSTTPSSPRCADRSPAAFHRGGQRGSDPP